MSSDDCAGRSSIQDVQLREQPSKLVSKLQDIGLYDTARRLKSAVEKDDKEQIKKVIYKPHKKHSAGAADVSDNPEDPPKGESVPLVRELSTDFQQLMNELRGNVKKSKKGLIEPSCTGCKRSDTSKYWATPELMYIVDAVESGHEEIVNMLVASHDQIMEPHPHDCYCEACKELKQDGYNYWRVVLQVYNAMASEVYLYAEVKHRYRDNPTSRMFELAHQMHLRSQKNSYFTKEFEELRDRVAGIATQLLENADDLDVVRRILCRGTCSHKEYDKKAMEDCDEMNMLRLAMTYERKEFATHAKVQYVLEETWGLERLLENVYSSVASNCCFTNCCWCPTKTIFRLFLTIFYFPLLAIAYVWTALLYATGLDRILSCCSATSSSNTDFENNNAPKEANAPERHPTLTGLLLNHAKLPAVTFYANFLSHVAFIGFISFWLWVVTEYELGQGAVFCQVRHHEPDGNWTARCFKTSSHRDLNVTDPSARNSNPSLDPSTSFAGDTFKRREMTVEPLVWILMLWIAGSIVNEVVEMAVRDWNRHGLRKNFVDWTAYFLYVCYFVAHLHSKFKTRDSWNCLHALTLNGTHPGGSCKRFKANINFTSQESVLHYLNANRTNWSWNDPTYFAETFFSVANVFTFLGSLHFFVEFRFFGPLYTAFVQMAGHVIGFFAIIIFFMMTFTVALYNLLRGYTNDNILSAFASPRRTMNTLFWAIFVISNGNLVSNEYFDYSDGDEPMRMSTITAMVLLGLYYTLMVVVLLNMLIAIMNNLYQEVEKNQNREWKWSQTELRLKYTPKSRKEPALLFPTPLNLITLPRLILKFAIWLVWWCRKKDWSCAGSQANMNKSLSTTTGTTASEISPSDRILQSKAPVDEMPANLFSGSITVGLGGQRTPARKAYGTMVPKILALYASDYKLAASVHSGDNPAGTLKPETCTTSV